MVSSEDLTDEQRRAVDSLDRNVALTAGAGTGKTTTLTARYLAMIERSIEARGDGGRVDDGDTDAGRDGPLLPENVLTTTFTERAANELERSVREEITDRIDSLDADEFEAWRAVADGLERGYVHTLHGFCARLLREHAMTIDAVDPGFETLDENESAALVHDTVGAVLEAYENHPATETLARRFSRSQLRDVLTDLLGERPESVAWADRWADADEEEYVAFVESALHPIDPDEAAARLSHPDFVDAAETLRAFVEAPPSIDTGGRAWERAEGVVERLPAGYDDGVPSRAKQTAIADLGMHLTTGKGERYAGYSGADSRWDGHPRKDEFDGAFETLVETLRPEAFAVEVDPAVEANSFPFVSALAELTRIAADEYETRKDRRNAVDFTDLVTHAVGFLDDPANAAVREELREQFAYVMVDEFQDTDPRQWDLVRLLTASDGGAFDARNVFVVGDVKQSIYRFRNADVTQFRETAETLRGRNGGDGDEDDRLSTNFRTLPTVLECVNELFESVFDADGEPYEAAPQSLRAARDDPADLGSVEYLAVPTDPDLRADRFGSFPEFAHAEPEHDAELEAAALAARLSRVLAEPLSVYPEESDSEGPPEPRAIEPNDVAVLIRSRTHLKAYERAFEEAGVPYSVASGVGFYETPEVTALVNLLRALADPSEGRALYATLRSPLFGFTDDTLARLSLEGDTLWEALAASDHDELEAARDSLAEWRRLAGLGDDAVGFDGSWAAFLTRVVDDTGYLVSVSADERPRQAVANVEKFREQLRGWSEEGVRSLATLVERIERRVELGGRESEADTTGDGVQILTIHDAKGMEFPYVAVPGVGRQFKDEAALGGGAVEFERVGDRYAVGMKAPSADDPFEMVDTVAREAIRERRRAEERAEEKRVLYVACTRARDHLLLTGLHDSAGEAEEPTMTDLEAPDPEAASSWRDWVQPELLTEEVCEELDGDTFVRRTYGDGAYAVSLPTPPAERDTEEAAADPTVAMTPSPPSPETTFRFSATDLAALLGSYGELRFDEDSKTVSVADTYDAEATRDGRRGEGASETPTPVDASVFGEMVHRLCELRPPEARWTDVMEQTLVDEDAAATLTPELERRAGAHARRGIEYVDELAAELDVEYRYDELYLTAAFDRGEISGYVDHLLVTPGAYHVVDYKTGAVAPEEVATEARYYENQLKAYAVALNQQDSGRRVTASLVFTAPDEAWDVEWSPEDLDAFEREISSEVWSRFDSDG